MERSNFPTLHLFLLAPLLGWGDGLYGRFTIFPAFYARLFLLQLFIIFGKMFRLLQQVGWNIRQALNVIPEWMEMGTQRIFSSGPFSFHLLNKPTGFASIMQPGKVGPQTETSASRASPFSAKVSEMKPSSVA